MFEKISVGNTNTDITDSTDKFSQVRITCRKAITSVIILIIRVRKKLCGKTNTDITDSTDYFSQGNNIRENPYNPCSRKTLLVKRTRIERIERITLLKQALPQGNNIRDNLYHPCSRKEDKSNKKVNYVTII